MCGILAVFGAFPLDAFLAKLQSLQHRGPDGLRMEARNGVLLGFVRLSIVDAHESAMQPLAFSTLPDCSLLYNGEIYNHAALLEGVPRASALDGEALAHAAQGGADAMKRVRGVYAGVLVDWAKNEVRVARDPLGVRPLYTSTGPAGQRAFASEPQALPWPDTVAHFPPGGMATFTLLPSGELTDMRFSVPLSPTVVSTLNPMPEDRHRLIFKLVIDEIDKRYTLRDPGVRACCLLSGGLDSSLVTARCAELARARGEPRLHAFTITHTEGGSDLPFAQMLANYSNVELTVVRVSFDELFSHARAVVRACRSFDPTTFRATSWMWCVCREIARTGLYKIVMSGEGPDEVVGGYTYLTRAPTPADFDVETRRLTTKVHMYDIARADGAAAAHGLEIRVPFFGVDFVRGIFSLLPHVRFTPQQEKKILRDAVAYCAPTLLPIAVLRRRKEAFSDAGSLPENSWHTFVERAAERYVAALPAERVRELRSRAHCPPEDHEEIMLRDMFEQELPDVSPTIVQEVWRPRFIASRKTSARDWDV